MVRDFRVCGICKILDCKKILCLLCTGWGQNSIICLLVYNIVSIYVIIAFLVIHFLNDVFSEPSCKGICSVIHIGRLFARTRNNERCSRLVYKDRVYLVNNGKVMSSLNHSLLIDHHIIAKIVKAEFIIGTVGNIRHISGFLLVRGKTVNDKSGAKTHKFINSSHLLTVTACKVVVYGYDMNALPTERIKICRHCCHKGLTLTCFHFRNTSLMEYDTAYYLHTEGTLTENTVVSLTNCGISICHNILKCLTICKTLLKNNRGRRKLLVAHLSILRC